MQKCKLILLTLMISVIFVGCEPISLLADNEADIYAKIHKRYFNMSSYTADVNLTIYSNKTENKYKVKQSFSAPDKMSAEILSPEAIAGTVVEINGDTAKVSSAQGELLVPAADDINYTFINEFFKMYYMSQETALSVSSENDSASSGITRLETDIIKNTSRRYKVAITIDNKTLNPVRLEVYDMAGEITLDAEYSNFIYD